MKYANKVAVIGMGYVGFPLACAIARNIKYTVYGLDIDKNKIDLINRNISPVKDKQAENDIKKVNLKASNDFSILRKVEYVLICVPTPVNKNKYPDLGPIIKAAKTVSENLKKGQVIIIESTINPGVCDDVILPVLERTGLKGGIDFELLHCPERINPGDEKWNVYNIRRNIGGLTKKGTKKGAKFYRSFIDAEVNEMSSLKVVESTKIVENTFRDINLAYVNELAQSFDVLGIDLKEVIEGASNKPFAFIPHFPGCGVGGHCIPVDPYYLIGYAKENGFNHQFLKRARMINNSMPKYTVDKFLRILKREGIRMKGTKVGVLGLSYKANIGDLRESPSFEIIKELKRYGCDILSFDPHCIKESNSDLNEILDECVGVIVATSHKEFSKMKKWGNVKLIVDGRNCLDGDKIRADGIVYCGIGRGENAKKSVKFQNNSANRLTDNFRGNYFFKLKGGLGFSQIKAR
jgi:UDP-N-acetyl-D-glucosamine dehydrogenase